MQQATGDLEQINKQQNKAQTLNLYYIKRCFVLTWTGDRYALVLKMPSGDVRVRPTSETGSVYNFIPLSQLIMGNLAVTEHLCISFCL